MPFDFGFDCRDLLARTTDPAYATCVLAEAYPHTYSNSNGLSINAGWGAGAVTIGGINTNDPRIVGANYKSAGNNGTPIFFTVDLSSGSAPGAGTYTVDLAVGIIWDTGGNYTQDFKLLDTNTVLIDGTNGGAGLAMGASNHLIDATLSNVAGGATWNGTTASKTFATTLVKFGSAYDNIGSFTGLSHLRLTLQDTVTNTNITPPSAVRLGL